MRFEHYRLAVFFVLPGLICGCGESIHDAAGSGDLQKVVKLTADNPALTDARSPNLNKTPLFYAVSYGRIKVVKHLIASGADVNAADRTGYTPLHVAAFRKQPEAAKLLLAAGADINARDAFGNTPAHSAAMKGIGSMAYFLVKRGADAGALNNDGLTLLQIAAKYGMHKTAKQLKPYIIDAVNASKEE